MRALLLFLAALTLPATVLADDWPQWRGLRRDGTSAETGCLAGWAENRSAPVAWRVPVGRGHSAVSVQGGLAYTMGWDGSQDSVFCLEVATGAVRWKQSYLSGKITQWSGPRSTPAIHGGVLFTLGQHGQLRAWDAFTGVPRWAVDLPKSYQPDPDYGFPWSPLILGELLILGTGSKGLALRKSDGSFAWGNDGSAGACVSPVPFLLGEKRGVAVVAMDPTREHLSVVGVDVLTGRELWRFGPWREKWGAACSDLIIHEGRAFISTAEQHKFCAQLQFHPGPVRAVWSNRYLSTYTGSVVLLAGHLYGVDKTGILKCLDWRTGEERWAQRGYGENGTLMAADGKLFVQASKTGLLTVVEATPARFHELRKMEVFTGGGETFTGPVLAQGRLYSRSYAGEVVSLALAPGR